MLIAVTKSVSSFDEGDKGEGGVIDSRVPELSRWPRSPPDSTVAFNKDPLVIVAVVMLTRDIQSGVTVTSPIASSEVHFLRSSMAEGCFGRIEEDGFHYTQYE